MGRWLRAVGRRGPGGAAGLVGESESSGAEGAPAAALRHFARQQRLYTERLSLTARHRGGGAGDAGDDVAAMWRRCCGAVETETQVSVVAGDVRRHSAPPSPADTAWPARAPGTRGRVGAYRGRVPGGGHGRGAARGAADGRGAAGWRGAVCGRDGGTGVCGGGGARRASGITVITSPFHTICTANENPATIIPGRGSLACCPPRRRLPPPRHWPARPRPRPDGHGGRPVGGERENRHVVGREAGVGGSGRGSPPPRSISW